MNDPGWTLRVEEGTSMVATELNALLELQKVDMRIRDLKAELRQKPQLLESRKAEVARLQAHVDKLNDEIKKRRMECDAQELEIKARQEQIAKSKRQQNTAKTNEEYSACTNSIKKVEAGSPRIMIAAYLSVLDVFGQATAFDAVLAPGDDTLGEALARSALRQRARPERAGAATGAEDEWEI